MSPIISGGGGGASPVLLTTVRLTSVDILALNTTPVTLVGGVAGSAVVPIMVAVVVIHGTVTYSSTHLIRVFNGPSFAGSGWGGTIFGNFGVDPSAASYDLPWARAGGDAQVLTLLDGQPLRLDTTAAVTTGDGTAVITTTYFLAPLT